MIEPGLIPVHIGAQIFGGAQIEPLQLGSETGALGLALGQSGKPIQGAFHLDQRADLLAGQCETFTQSGVTFVEEHHLGSNLVQPALAIFHLAEDGARTDEPVSVDLRVEVAVRKVAAHETFAGDGAALGAHFFEGIALDIMTQQQVNEGPGGGMRCGNFGSQRILGCVICAVRGVLQHAPGIEKRNPMQAIFVAAVTVEFCGRVVLCGRNEQGKTVVAKHTFDGILPGLVGDIQYRAQEDRFFTGKPQFGAQQTAQAAGLRGFAFVTDLPVAGAQFADFIFEPGSFGAQGDYLFIEQRVLAGVIMRHGSVGFLQGAYCVSCFVILVFRDEDIESGGNGTIVDSQ